MRVIMNIKMPPEPFNTLVRQGTSGSTLQAILEDLKPEAAYFYAPGGCRGATLIVNVEDPGKIPFFAEPFFLKFNAECEFHIAMTPGDLANAGLNELGEKWG